MKRFYQGHSAQTSQQLANAQASVASVASCNPPSQAWACRLAEHQDRHN